MNGPSARDARELRGERDRDREQEQDEDAAWENAYEDVENKLGAKEITEDQVILDFKSFFVVATAT